MDLYPHQTEIIARARAEIAQGRRNIVLCMPTGAGKTVTAAAIIQSAISKQGRVLFAAHRIELCQQAARTLLDAGVKSTAVVGGSAQAIGDTPFQIGMIQTLAKRITKAVRPPRPPSILFVDECHHAAAKSYRKVINKLREWNPQLITIGLTATPQRLDGKGLDKDFDALVIGKSTGELIAEDFLSQYTLFAPATGISAMRDDLKTKMGEFDIKQQSDGIGRLGKGIFGDYINLYREYLPGKQCILFAIDRAHSQKTAAEFKAAGISAAHIDGSFAAGARAQIINAFRRGEIKVLTNVGIINEGFDCPSASGVIIARCTKSIANYLQMCGRALRYDINNPDKRAVIADLGGNVHKLGMPCAAREWSLAGFAGKVSGNAVKKTTKQCKECAAIIPIAKTNCPNCNALCITPREIEHHKDAKMVAVNGVQIPKKTLPRKQYAQLLESARGDFNRLREIQKQMGYAHGWVYHAAREWKAKQQAAA